MTKFKLLSIFALFLTSITVTAIGERTVSNQIAFIGTDYNIYTHSLDTNTTNQLTDDASETRRYQWTTWSADGQLAYFCCEFNPVIGNDAEIYISPDGIQSATLAREIDDTSVIYASWSPEGRNLAILANNLVSGGLSVEVIQNNSEFLPAVTEGVSSFYFDWASSGDEIIFHQNNRDLGVYSLTQADDTQTLDASSGRFQTPQWSPVDNRLLVGLTGSATGLTDLVIINADGTQNTVATDLADFVSFLWSPDGTQIAYRTIDQFGFNDIVVVDAITGEEIASSTSTGIIAFFWSPDSIQIAFVTFQNSNQNQSAFSDDSVSYTRQINQLVQNESPTVLTWHILDIEANAELRYSSFIPTFEMIYILNYFDQFASSHRIWSPDSQQLVFSGFFAENQPEPSIYTLDISETDNNPEFIAEGVFGVWSFE